MKKLLITSLLLMIACTAFAMDRIGIDGTGVPFVSFKINDTQMADLGLSYSSTNNGAATNLNLLGRIENGIMNLDKVKLYWAGQLLINSAAGASTITIDGIVGAEYKVSKNLGIYGNIDLVTIQSAAGASSFGS